MAGLIILIPLFILALALVYGAALRIYSTWLDYRIRIQLLEQIEAHPESAPTPEQLHAILNASPKTDTRRGKINYALTGIFLIVIGAACALIGFQLRVGQLAVGSYIGGHICLCMGIVFVLFGTAERFLKRGSTGVLRQ